MALLGGCSISPEPIGTPEHLERAKADAAKLYANQIPLNGPLSAHEAIARALKYNYDNQLAMTEVALQTAQFDLAVLNTLPRLAASAGYTWRDNENASSSISVLTRRQSLEPSTSQDQNRGTGDLSFSWNLLDFGVSYFQARQQGDRALIAVERRRRVINNIVKEVRSAYWRAATAQRLLPRIGPLIEQAEKALKANAEIERNALEPVLQTLEYRKNLLQVVGQLRRLQSDLSVAKAQLAALINVPPTTPFTVLEPEAEPEIPRSISADVATLELTGLTMRPELREEAYQERVDRNNLRKEIVRLLPGISLLGSLNFDSNSFLVNNLWAEAGVRVTYNLVNLIQAPTALEAAETQIEVARARRLALSVAVLTQVNIGYQQFLRAIEAFDTAQEIAQVEARIARAVNDAGLAEAEPEFEQIRRGLSAVAAELDRDRSFTDLQTALANLYTSIGIDPIPASVETTNLPELTETVRLALADLDRGHIPVLPTGPTPVEPSSAPTAEVPPPSATPAATPAVVPVAEAAAPPPAPEPSVPASTAAPVVDLSGGDWRVQFATVGSEDAARAEWHRFVALYPELLEGVEPQIRRSDLGERGTVYRVLGAGLSGVRAHEICAGVAAEGTGCRVVPAARTRTAVADIPPADAPPIQTLASPTAHRRALAAAAATPAGGWRVQLATVDTEDDARSEWRRLSALYPAALAGLEPQVRPSDLGERGIVYRLLGAGLDEERANTVCAQLAAGGAGCRVVPAWRGRAAPMVAPVAAPNAAPLPAAAAPLPAAGGGRVDLADAVPAAEGTSPSLP